MLSTFSRLVPSKVYEAWDLLDPFSCQLHHIAFDRLKSHTPSCCLHKEAVGLHLPSED